MIFFTSTRLLERAARLSKDNGGGSDSSSNYRNSPEMSQLISTNVIYRRTNLLESDMLTGNRPAVNVGLSVSRVGGSAQIKAMKSVAGTLRLDLAQFRSLEAFAQFGSDLDEATKNQLDRGRRIVEILKQPQYNPIPVEQQVVLIWAVTNGFLDDIAIENLSSFQEKYLDSLITKGKNLLKQIKDEKVLTEKITKELEKFTVDFKNHLRRNLWQELKN